MTSSPPLDNTGHLLSGTQVRGRAEDPTGVPPPPCSIAVAPSLARRPQIGVRRRSESPQAERASESREANPELEQASAAVKTHLRLAKMNEVNFNQSSSGEGWQVLSRNGATSRLTVGWCFRTSRGRNRINSGEGKSCFGEELLSMLLGAFL